MSSEKLFSEGLRFRAEIAQQRIDRDLDPRPGIDDWLQECGLLSKEDVAFGMSHDWCHAAITNPLDEFDRIRWEECFLPTEFQKRERMAIAQVAEDILFKFTAIDCRVEDLDFGTRQNGERDACRLQFQIERRDMRQDVGAKQVDRTMAMRRGRDDGDAIGNAEPRQLQTLGQRCWSVVDAWQNMAVEIYHSRIDPSIEWDCYYSGIGRVQTGLSRF